MSDDWQDMYNGDVQNLGASPYSFNGKLPQAQPQQQQGMGGGTLAGLAAALMKYSGNSGTNLNGGGVMAGYGSNDAFGGSVGGASGSVDYGGGYVPMPDYTGG